MKIRVKLMATLRARLPAEARGQAELDLPDGATVQHVLDHLDVATHIHVVMVNEEMERNRERPLVEGDSLVLIPPVAGG